MCGGGRTGIEEKAQQEETGGQYLQHMIALISNHSSNQFLSYCHSGKFTFTSFTHLLKLRQRSFSTHFSSASYIGDSFSVNGVECEKQTLLWEGLFNSKHMLLRTVKANSNV